MNMKTKYFFSGVFLLLSMSAIAQETYEDTKLIDNDLNGTARYVGMGGAMEALGADISTISSNPAGIGLFRHSMGSLSFGLVSQQNGKSFKNGSPTNASFDQLGFVYVLRDDGDNNFLNFGFNYHKSRNFDYILSTADRLDKASQNTLSFLKAIGGDKADGTSDFNVESRTGGVMGKLPYTSQLDNLYYNTFILNSDMQPAYNVADGYIMNRANTGYIGEYDFNFSGNVHDRVYFGLTIGLHDVHYKGTSEYTENLLDWQGKAVGTVTINDERRITGTGFSFKGGVIFRPIEASPFRIGLSVSTPTWYDLRTQNTTYLVNNTSYKGINPHWRTRETYDFKLITPWKFGVSLGHTIGKYLALGATYEYADYGKIDNRVNDGGTYGYDYYGYPEYYESSHQDVAMNRHTEKTLKGVSTFKVGVEIKPMPKLAFRAGYNYLSPLFNKNGYKDGSIDSYGSNYSSATDYTNWKATNRITMGVGYTIKQFSFDLAYQYSMTDGDFYPFMGGEGIYNSIDTTTGKKVSEHITNYADATNVSNKRHQLLLTFGYRF